MSRAGVIRKIERCAALANSANPHEAMLSASRALDLASKYEVRPDELADDARRTLFAHDIASKLSVHASRLTRLALFCGGEAGQWQVTGLGADCTVDQMIAYAISLGIGSRWAA